MRHRHLVPLFLSTLCPLALSEDVQRQDQLVWDYAEFVEEFSAKEWSRVARFVTPETKIGIGGESGMEGLMQVFGADDECHRAMVRVLELGCRKIGEGESMSCVSPPHLGPDVIYLGARASFQYSTDSDTWMAVYLICGGD